jgi:hypothetical protein
VVVAPGDDAVVAAPGDDATGEAPGDDAAGAAPADDGVVAAPGSDATGNHGDQSHGWKGAGHWASGGRGHEKWHKSSDPTAEDASPGRGHRGHWDSDHKHGAGQAEPDSGKVGGDWHKGGAGADAYAFFKALGAKHAGNFDKFVDFDSKHDMIDWSSGHFKSLTKAGSQGASGFAADTHAQVQGGGDYGAGANDTGTYQYNGAGAGDAIDVADLNQHSSSNAADFVII